VQWVGVIKVKRPLSRSHQRQKSITSGPLKKFFWRGDLGDGHEIRQMREVRVGGTVEHRIKLIALERVKGEEAVNFWHMIQQVAIGEVTKAFDEEIILGVSDDKSAEFFGCSRRTVALASGGRCSVLISTVCTALRISAQSVLRLSIPAYGRQFCLITLTL